MSGAGAPLDRTPVDNGLFHAFGFGRELTLNTNKKINLGEYKKNLAIEKENIWLSLQSSSSMSDGDSLHKNSYKDCDSSSTEDEEK